MMKGTKAQIAAASTFELHCLSNDIDNADSAVNLFNHLLRYPTCHESTLLMLFANFVSKFLKFCCARSTRFPLDSLVETNGKLHFSFLRFDPFNHSGRCLFDCPVSHINNMTIEFSVKLIGIS